MSDMGDPVPRMHDLTSKIGVEINKSKGSEGDNNIAE